MKMMLPLLVLWLSVSGTYSSSVRKDGGYGDGVNPSPVGCQNCSICPYPCHPQYPPPPPPPPSGYPSPGAQPPPVGAGNCPPGPPGCCQYPQSSTPPSPPSPYTYVPYNNYSASPPAAVSRKPPVFVFLANIIFFGFVSFYLV